LPSNAPTKRIADEHGMLDPELVEEISDEARVMFDPVIVVGKRPSKAEPRQIRN